MPLLPAVIYCSGQHPIPPHRGSTGSQSRVAARPVPPPSFPDFLNLPLCEKRRGSEMVGMLPETNAAAKAEVLLDAWDFKGRPAARSTTGRWGAAAMILGRPVRPSSFLHLIKSSLPFPHLCIHLYDRQRIKLLVGVTALLARISASLLLCRPLLLSLSNLY
jgi:hypothetical protein